MTELTIDIALEDEKWGDEQQLHSLCTSAFAEALKQTKLTLLPQSEISAVFTNDQAIKALNSDWRTKDQPTNVLSFPLQQIKPGDVPPPMLGDIVLAYETLERESIDLRISYNAHLTHLLVHGFLHLLGYDHIEDDEADQMEQLEIRILAGLGVENPYIEPQ